MSADPGCPIRITMTPAVQDASCAAGAFLCRGSEALPSGSYPPSKKEYFLTATTPQSLARGVTAQLVQKPRRVSPMARQKKVRSFSPATCAAEKILLRLQVWNLCALGAQIMRAADCSPFVKKEYFLTATTPQALARGVTAQLVQKPRRVSPPQRRKKVSIIFSGDMRGGENTSQAASVEFVCPRRTNYARSRLQPLCQKVILFDSLKAARPTRGAQPRFIRP